jgi:hypothetical protein
MNLQKQIRIILREETHLSNYVKRRILCFDDFINKLENNELDFMTPEVIGARLDWNYYKILLVAFMRNHCGDNGYYYDENLHQKIIDQYGDRLYKWFKKNIE